MKKLIVLVWMGLLVSCGSPDQYEIELGGSIVEGKNADQGTVSIDMYRDRCEADFEVFTSASFNLTVKPIIVNEPGQSDVANDLYINLESVDIEYTTRTNALGNPGADIAAVTVKDVSQRELKVNDENETSFLFLSLDQKAQWRSDMEPETGEFYLYDYRMVLTFTDDEGEVIQTEELTGTFEVGHFDKCE